MATGYDIVAAGRFLLRPRRGATHLPPCANAAQSNRAVSPSCARDELAPSPRATAAADSADARRASASAAFFAFRRSARCRLITCGATPCHIAVKHTCGRDAHNTLNPHKRRRHTRTGKPDCQRSAKPESLKTSLCAQRCPVRPLHSRGCVVLSVRGSLARAPTHGRALARARERVARTS